MDKCVYCGHEVKQVGAGIFYCTDCDDIITDERRAEIHQ